MMRPLPQACLQGGDYKQYMQSYGGDYSSSSKYQL